MVSENNPNKSVSPAQEESVDRRTLWLLLTGIFLLSFSLLAFEITLARILSVVLFYHYVFLVVSLALLGLGAGGIFVHLFRPRIPHKDSRFGSLALFASLFSLSIPLSVIIITRIAYIDNVVGGILLYCLLLFIPFFFVGILLAEVFRMFPTFSSRIYGADLVGAAAGSLAVVLILQTLGDLNSSLLYALIAAMAALLIATRLVRINSKAIILPAISFVVVLVLLGTNLIGSYLPNIPIGRNPVKEISRFLEINYGAKGSSARGEIVETRWSAFGRTDLVKTGEDIGYMVLFIDGTSGTPMYQFNGNLDNPDSSIDSLKKDFVGYLPFLHLQETERDNALIIGPGGGRDILLALMGGVGDITAVEVNKDLVDIVKEYARYNGGIYTDLANVSVTVDEGRNFLKRQKNEKYDIIMLSLTVTRTSRSLEGYSLTENFLSTTESINDYLEHLTDEGRLMVVSHDPAETLRLLSISLATLEQRGVNQEAAMKQIYIAGSEMYDVFVMAKTPFEPAKLESINQSIKQMGYEPIMLTPVFVSMSKGESSFADLEERFLKDYGLDISPVTDNSPFFYKFEAGIPQSVTIVLWLSIFVLLITIVVSLIYSRKRSAYREVSQADRSRLNKNLIRFVVFFLMLGTGFMLVEISTIQRFILFLGQPVLSMAVLLFSLLVGAGIGSLYSNRFTSERLTKVIAIVSVSIVALLFVYVFLIPIILEQLLGLELAIRLLVTVVLITPLGFLMGFPFPLGLRLLKETSMEDYIPWMWGINGISSVLGSAMTLVIAINFGFTQALILGAGCYFIVFLTFQMTQPRRRSLAQKGGDSDG